MSGSDTSTRREWEYAFNSLQELISSEMAEDELMQKVVSISLSIDDNHKLKLFTWMLDTLCDPTNDDDDDDNDNDTNLHKVLLELIPSITSRDDEEKLIQGLKSYVAKKKSQGTQTATAILSITRMLHRARTRFKPMPMLHFLSWCTDIIKEKYEAEGCIHEIVKLQFSFMALLDDEADILGKLKAVRRSIDIRLYHDNEAVCRSILREITQVMISSLQYDNVRAAYQSVLLVTEPKDWNGLDSMIYVVLFHLYKDTRHKLLKLLHKDMIVKADDRCNMSMSMSTSKKTHCSSYILPLIITTMKQIDVSSFEMPMQSILIQAASDLGLHLLHSPIHHPQYPPLDYFERELKVQLPIQLVMTRTKQYISDLFGILPSENKDQMVSALLSVSDTNIEIDEKEEKTFWSAKEELMERFPLSIRKIIKVGEVPDDSNPVQRRHWEDVCTSSAIILVGIIKRYKVLFGMDIILGRLEAFGRKQWSGKRPKSDVSSTNNYHDFECAIAEIYCDALVAYAENVESGQCTHDIDNIDLMTMIQRMLLSFFDLDKPKRLNMVDRNGSVVLGMILAKCFVQSTMSSDEDCNMVVEWVTRIVVNQDDSEWLQLDAVTGYWGIWLICSLCPEVDTSQFFSFGHTLIKNDDTKSKACSLSVEDVFDRIKVLALSRIGMVQSESTVMTNATTESVLGYTKTPRCFFQPTGKSKKRLTFCVASLCRKLNPNGTQSSSEIQEWFRFVGCLTGVYLKFAYVTSGKKWAADCWLLASIELLPYTESDAIELSSNYRFVHSMGEVSLEMEDLEDIDSMSTSVLFQSAYTFIIAIAVEHAVLMNCYSFFLKNGAKTTKAELLMRLIQYQLAKLYDLNHHFHRIMEFVMDLNDQGPEDSNGIVKAEELKAFISNVFHSVTFIPPTLLLDALHSMGNHSLTKEWDNSIRSVVTQKRISTSLEVSLQSLLDGLVLECCASHHLNSIIKHRKRVLEQTGGDSAVHSIVLVLPLEVEKALAAFQSLKMKMLWLPLCKRFYVSDHYLSGTMILRDPMAVRNISDHARNAIILHLGLVQHAIHTNLGPEESAEFVTSLLAAGVSNNIQSDDLVSPQSSPLYELTKCIMLTDESIITSHMLDLVSYLPLKRYDWIQKVTWKFVTSLDNDKTIEPPEAQILYHLPLPFVECICDHLDPDISTNDATNKALINLVRLATKRMVDYNGTIDLSHIILTNWSHAISQETPSICYEHFNQLVSTIEHLLQSESGSTKSGRSSQTIYKSAKAGVAVKLDFSSVPVIYDLILHLVAATLGVFGRLRISATNIDADRSKVSGREIDQVLKVLKIYDKMMNIYSLRNNNFPKSMMQSTVNVCLLVIRICEGIASKYSKREIIDAFPRKRTLSANPLKSLVDGMKEYCCDAVSKVCNIDSSSDRTRLEVTLSSLLTRNEKMRRFLFSLESACNLIPSSLMALPSDVHHVAKRRSGATVNRSPKKARVEDKISFHTERHSVKDVVCTTAQDDDDSFGVDGDWGNDTGSDLEDGKLQVDVSF